jgi:hypothetical protein
MECNEAITRAVKIVLVTLLRRLEEEAIEGIEDVIGDGCPFLEGPQGAIFVIESAAKQSHGVVEHALEIASSLRSSQ